VDGVDAVVGMETDGVNIAVARVDLLMLRRHRKKGLGGG
jgi:adenine/guanine phosphoribosyltransferase-like PRPP-binding protein